ncbi:MAG TPA: hypothetical protein VKU38_23285 [Ktedonobacteraceae bacterium]|nr:hypothetical protein [Ktedonobacteraceae bacterium]
MRQRVRMLVTALVIIGTFMAIIPTGVSAASSASSSSTTKQNQQSNSPHLFFKGNVRPQPLAGSNLNYGGGPVMTGTTNAYAIFWEPGNNVSANYNSLIKRYFGDVGGSQLYQINNQYTQTGGGFPSNAVLAGSWVDSQAYPETPVLDSDLQNEVTHAQQVNGWKSSIDNIFFVFTGRGEDICTDSSQSQCASNTFCAYHNFFGTNTIYAAMPYAASFSCNPGSSPNNDDADQTINVTSHEQMEAATDPLLNAWLDSSGQEIGDKCAWTFGSLNSQGADVVWNNDPYIVQQEWDNNTSTCRLTPSIIKGGGTFSTGFESGQPQPTWTNTVDGGGQPAGGLKNVGGVCCGLSGPESGVRHELAHAGTIALMYSGRDNSSSSSFAYMKIFDLTGQNVTVGSATTLSYWIYPQSSATSKLVSGSNSTCVAIDLIFNDNTNLRDSGAVDQNGVRVHPAYQCNHLKMDTWNLVTVKLGSYKSGKIILRIDVGYDQPGNTGGYRGYIDDISIA